ncbi:MAG: hypothetical protein AAFX04_05650 [Pseudomonadota bacterium]
MSGDHLILAIGRLERAVSRLEQQAQAQTAAMDTDDLVSRAEHDRLRQAAEDAVKRIDRIIGTEGS